MNDKIKLPALRKILKELEADETTTQLIINTAKLYNTLLERFQNGENVHPYMLTGTNGQVFNQLLALKKLKSKDKEKKPDEEYPFDKLLLSMNKKK